MSVTPIAAARKRVISIAEEPARAREYRHAISVHCPNQSEGQMTYRVALCDLRDRASAGLARCCDAAAPLLHAIAGQAAVAAFAPWSERKLYATRAALELTMMAARQVEWAHGCG